MSTNKTQNYNLHSWVPEDDFLRSEFNDNFTSLDGALKTLSDGLSAEAQARAAAVTAEENARNQAIAAEQAARSQAVAAEQAAREKAVSDEVAARKKAVSDEAAARASAVTAEQNARKQAITAEQNARTAAISSLTATKAELVIGTYTGGVYDSTETYTRTISLGYTPKAMLIVRQNGCMGQSYSVAGGLLMPGHPLYDGGSKAAELSNGNLILYKTSYGDLNDVNKEYRYIAIK